MKSIESHKINYKEWTLDKACAFLYGYTKKVIINDNNHFHGSVQNTFKMMTVGQSNNMPVCESVGAITSVIFLMTCFKSALWNLFF